MSSVLLTMLLASIVVLLAIASLGIGWLLTGKSKIQPGACGRNPRLSKDKECGTRSSCSLCEHNPCDAPTEPKPDNEIDKETDDDEHIQQK